MSERNTKYLNKEINSLIKISFYKWNIPSVDSGTAASHQPPDKPGIDRYYN